MKIANKQAAASNFKWIKCVISNVTRKKHFIDYSDQNIDHMINEIEKTLNRLKELNKQEL